MTQEFCEHLEDYSIAFGRAKASYGNCLNLIEKIIEDPAEKELRTTMEHSLDDWVQETRDLRMLFKNMVKSGGIELAGNSGSGEESNQDSILATCSECSFQIPKLVFSEFDLTDEENPLYQGQALPQPAGAGV